MIGDEPSGRLHEQLFGRLFSGLSKVDWRSASERDRLYAMFRDVLGRWNQQNDPSQVSNARALSALDEVIALVEQEQPAAPDIAALARAVQMELHRRGLMADLAADEPPPAQPEVATPPPSHVDPTTVVTVAPTPASGADTSAGQVSRRVIFAAYTALGLALLTLAWVAFGSRGGDCGGAVGCHDSGWVSARARPTNVLTIPHTLGAEPRSMSVWFSPTATGERVWLLTWRWPGGESGNPISFEADAGATRLHLWEGAPLFGAYNAATGSWTIHQTGFFRVVVRR